MASIAHVGYGYWGKNLARNFAELGCLKAVCDPDARAAQSAAATHKVPALSFEAILSDPTINAVSIASPAEMHFAHAKAALDAGKHVFVEKPLALDVGHAEELCALAEKRGLTLMVGHLMQYHPLYIKLREMVHTGEFGRLAYIYSNRLSLGKFRRGENVLWSFAPHDISMILALFNSEPLSVTAQGSVAFSPDVADMVTMQMHFAGGGGGHVQTCWMHPFKEQRLVVIGEAAMAVLEDSEPDWDSKLKIYRHSIDASGPLPIPTQAEPERVLVPRSEPLRAECQHFVECVDAGAAPRTDGAEGLRVLRVLDKAERALADNLRHQEAAKAEGEGS